MIEAISYTDTGGLTHYYLQTLTETPISADFIIFGIVFLFLIVIFFK